MPDSNYSSVRLLLNGDGPNATTSFIDLSSAPRTVTANGNAQVSTAQSKFGVGSIRLDGAGDFLSVANSPDTQPDAVGDFTAELWMYIVGFTSGVTGTQGTSESTLLWNRNAGRTQGWGLMVAADGTGINTEIQHATASGPYADLSGSPLALNTWYHVALTRQGTVYRVFVDGVMGVNSTKTGNFVVNTTDVMKIGQSGRYEDFNGYIDDVRITKGIARYTANFTPPTIAHEYPLTSITGAAALALPALTLTATGSQPVISAFSLPKLTAVAYGGGNSAVALPSLSVSATARDVTGERAFNGTLPSLRLTAFGGANANLTTPAISVSITGRATIMGSAPLVLPTLDLNGVGRTAGQAVAALQLPAIRAGGFSGAVASVTIGGVTLAASGTTGGISRANLTLPLFELTAGATRQRSGSANVSLPALSMATTGAAQIVIPGPRLTAIGTATVAVTYEAYALNLKHNAEVNDELTRYTNYPFDRIVRYKNSYYGMNSTGLYLLEGTTDFAEPAPTPIAWSWKTTLTDFESAQQKTVQWAYFGGRMGPAATVSIHYGDTGQESYAYASPRGASAQNYRQGFGRGIKSRYYALGAAGSGALALDHIVFNIATLARKV